MNGIDTGEARVFGASRLLAEIPFAELENRQGSRSETRGLL